MSHRFVATAILTGEWSRLRVLVLDYIRNAYIREYINT